MSLPSLPQKDNFRREVRTEWGGLNLNENAGDGELIEALNMSSREYPLLATTRFSKTRADRAMSLPFAYAGRLGYQYKAGSDYYLYDPFHPTASNAVRHNVPGETQYAILGHRMCIFPSKQMYDFKTGTISDMESGLTIAARFVDEYKAGVKTASTIIVNTMPPFNVGDAVTVSGCRIFPENNTTVIIREIVKHLFGSDVYWIIKFDADAFSLHTLVYQNSTALPAGTYHFQSNVPGIDQQVEPVWSYFSLPDELPANSTITYAPGDVWAYVYPAGSAYMHMTAVGPGESGTLLWFNWAEFGYEESSVTLSRNVPDLDYVCANENRVWGCKGDTIYCSKLGDPLNWNVFDGLSTDSWTVETGTPGDFTGCCSFQGYPTFFKENAVFKVLGDTPQNFTLRKQNVMGVYAGAWRSIVEIRGLLYYLSQAGVMAWNGGDYPSIISGAIGLETGQVTAGDVRAGTDAIRYYIETSPQRYERDIGWWVQQPGIYVYDTRYGTWHKIHKESGEAKTEFAGDGTHNWMLKDLEDGVPLVYALHSFPALEDTGTEWRVTFADSTRAYKTALTGSESKKGVLRLLIRCRLAGSMKVWIAYDGGEFEQAGEFGGEDGLAKTSKVVPLILRRCDFWQLRLTGVGDAVIYSIAVERYGGEWQQA